MEEINTFVFAPEIETALTSLCFYNPEQIGRLKRELDPQLAITQPHLRHILEAIEISYRELGERDFASVITVLRELGQLEACGGPEGVNVVFEAYRYGFSSGQAEQEIFSHYIDMLKRYALARAHNAPIYRFVRGDFVLEPNAFKRSSTAPDYVGAGKFSGRLCRALAYQNSSQIRLTILPQ